MTEDILIIVKTYPQMSDKYDETVCIVGIRKRDKKLVRLYPLRYRYLDPRQQFSKYQWITVDLSKPNEDSRPESFRPDVDIIKKEKISTRDDWGERIPWVLDKQNVYESVEFLKECQKEKNTSLGIAKIREIIKFYPEKKKPEELKEAILKKDSIINQGQLFGEQLKDLEIIPYNLKLNFLCDNPDCKGHDMSILDWEFIELYRKYKTNWEDKIRTKIEEICSEERDTYIILGNIARWQNIFCILGFFYPPKERNLLLF